MSISVVATGLVVEGPSPATGGGRAGGLRPGPVPRVAGIAGLAHACEVGVSPEQHACVRDSETLQWGDRVEVTGQLVMERVDGPVEDDLSAVRVWIEAIRSFRSREEEA